MIHNGLERSFASLHVALIMAIQGKDRYRQHIAKMRIKGLNIVLSKLSAVCYLTCDIFLFIYKLYRQTFGIMVTFS